MSSNSRFVTRKGVTNNTTSGKSPYGGLFGIIGSVPFKFGSCRNVLIYVLTGIFIKIKCNCQSVYEKHGKIRELMCCRVVFTLEGHGSCGGDPSLRGRHTISYSEEGNSRQFVVSSNSGQYRNMKAIFHFPLCHTTFQKSLPTPISKLYISFYSGVNPFKIQHEFVFG